MSQAGQSAHEEEQARALAANMVRPVLGIPYIARQLNLGKLRFGCEYHADKARAGVRSQHWSDWTYRQPAALEYPVEACAHARRALRT